LDAIDNNAPVVAATVSARTGIRAVNLVELGDRHGDWEVVGESVLIDRLAHSTNGIGLGKTRGLTMAGTWRIRPSS
jgi:hypothetical protein